LILKGIIVVCYSVLSLAFFLMFNIKDIIDSDHCLLLPWLILTVVLTMFVFISACVLSNGLTTLCNNMVNINDPTFGFYMSCRRTQYFKWKNYNSNHFYDYLSLCVACIWLLFIVCCLMLLILVIRIYKLYEIFEKETDIFNNQNEYDDNISSDNNHNNLNTKMLTSFIMFLASTSGDSDV
jgi:hypothetical protein